MHHACRMSVRLFVPKGMNEERKKERKKEKLTDTSSELVCQSCPCSEVKVRLLRDQENKRIKENRRTNSPSSLSLFLPIHQSIVHSLTETETL